MKLNVNIKPHRQESLPLLSECMHPFQSLLFLPVRSQPLLPHNIYPYAPPFTISFFLRFSSVYRIFSQNTKIENQIHGSLSIITIHISILFQLPYNFLTIPTKDLLPPAPISVESAHNQGKKAKNLRYPYKVKQCLKSKNKSKHDYLYLPGRIINCFISFENKLSEF